MNNSNVFYRRFIIAYHLVKEGQGKSIITSLKLRLYSDITTIGLKRDLMVPFNPPKAKIDISLRLFNMNDINSLKESHRHERLVSENIPTCFVAITKDNEACYRQWLIGYRENHRIQKYFGNLFPILKDDEALLEGAFTHPDFRGMGIMPEAMSLIAEKGSEINARWIITFVERNNIASLKGCKRSGFEPYILRKEKWRLFQRYVNFEAIPENILIQYSHEVAA